MDLIDATTRPSLVIQLPEASHLGRNEEATVRVLSRGALPHEFMLQVRFTAFPQEAGFRIRPFDESKIERL